MLWKEKETSRIRAAQMDNHRGLLGFRRMDRVPNGRVRELCGVTNGLDKRINEGVLQWFGYVERMEKERIAKVVYIGECAGNHSVGRPRKRWIDSMKECLRKRGLDVRQARRVVQGKSKSWGLVRGTLTRCQNCGLSELYEACGYKSVCGRAHNLKGIRVNLLLFFSFMA